MINWFKKKSLKDYKMESIQYAKSLFIDGIINDSACKRCVVDISNCNCIGDIEVILDGLHIAKKKHERYLQEIAYEERVSK